MCWVMVTEFNMCSISVKLCITAKNISGSELYPDCDVFHVTMGTCYVKIGHKLAAFNTFKRLLILLLSFNTSHVED